MKKAAKTTGLSDDSAPSANGRYISVYDFFWDKYGWAVANTDIPVINVGTRERPTYLPPEVCIVFAGQKATSRLDRAQEQEMLRFASRKPWENATSIIRDGLETVGLSPQTNVLLDQFNVSVSPRLITVPGRVIPAPKVIYNENKPAKVRFGGWNMVDVKFYTAVRLKRWSYLLISLPDHRDAFDRAGLAAVIRRFGDTLSATGITVEPPSPGYRLVMNAPDDMQLDQYLKNAAKALDLLLIVLPESNTPIYNRIKRCCDKDYGIHTVCVVGRKLAKERCQDQFLANVALKLNLKLGGNNQLVDSARLGIVNEDKTMIVGIDVTHPSPSSRLHAPSIAGMVASIDKWLGQWPAVLRVQQARQEMVSDLADMLKSRLRLWKDLGKHQALPENILVYRDGVSEGQYQKVIDEELPLLRKACEEMYPVVDQERRVPRFTIIIVGKRHHTRFYPTREADADRSSNPKPGTIVDRGVTDPRSWDFFLQSHAAIQGTARPAHYVVVLDEIFRAHHKSAGPPFQNAADRLEDLTQSMCYIYGRATKAVSICTPAYYASVLCERARRYLSGIFDPSLISTTPSIASSMEEAAVGNEELKVHPRLRNSMFYI
ncbi:Protein argonaute 5 [Madurella mycetomatis]|nr:Protein argonaute 5 [Madurella mycetomatis]